MDTRPISVFPLIQVLIKSLSRNRHLRESKLLRKADACWQNWYFLVLEHLHQQHYQLHWILRQSGWLDRAWWPQYLSDPTAWKENWHSAGVCEVAEVSWAGLVPPAGTHSAYFLYSQVSVLLSPNLPIKCWRKSNEKTDVWWSSCIHP